MRAGLVGFPPHLNPLPLSGARRFLDYFLANSSIQNQTIFYLASFPLPMGEGQDGSGRPGSFPSTLIHPLRRLCRKSVHGSTGSPRTEHGALEINCLAVRPELVEGRAADYDTVSRGGGIYFL